VRVEWSPAKPSKLRRGFLPLLDRAMREAHRINGRYPRVMRLTVDERGKVVAAEAVR